MHLVCDWTERKALPLNAIYCAIAQFCTKFERMEEKIGDVFLIKACICCSSQYVFTIKTLKCPESSLKRISIEEQQTLIVTVSQWLALCSR